MTFPYHCPAKYTKECKSPYKREHEIMSFAGKWMELE
jgi:hypothetical protein